jgi:NAD(P) transhydrogenase subunit beta
MISANITASLYLVTGILFIMALRGLSSPETSRTGNFLGILGMGLAVIVTLLSLGDINQIKENILYILIPIIIGGLVGGIIAFRVSMTAMPQLVAGFHSLVGLSAVLVGIVAFYNPASFGIGQVGNIKILSLVEMSLGVAIGAITFSGSCIAFLKLQGLMSGNPITFKGQHLINLLIGLLIVF